MLGLMKVVISGEMLFLLFLISGYLNTFFSFPFDATIMLFALSLIYGLFKFIKKPIISKYTILPISIFIGLIFMYLISFLYTESIVYANEKILKFIVLTGWSFLGVYLILNSKESLSKFFKAMSLVTFSLSLLFLVEFFIGFSNTIGVENYLPKSRIAGMSSLLFLGLLFYDNKSNKTKSILLLSAFLISFSVLITSGARASILAVLIVTLIIILSFVKIKGGVLYYSKRIKYLIGSVFVGALALAFLFRRGFLETTLWRIERALEDQGTGRLERFRIGIESWSDSLYSLLFGKGVGSFGMEYSGSDIVEYPHNIFIELLSEVGFIGFSLFVILLFVAFRRLMKTEGNHIIAKQSFLILLFVFIGANVSGDINDNRILLSFIAISTVLPFYLKDVNKVGLQHKGKYEKEVSMIS